MSQQLNKVPPANCRQQLAGDGKPYPRSSCAVCGQFSPRWKECDALLGAAPVPPAGEWEKLAKHLAYYLPSALVSHQHMMTPETLSDALEALHKVRNMPVPPSGREVEVFNGWVNGCPEQVELVIEKDHRAHVTRLQAEIDQLTETTFGQEQVIETLEARAAQKDDLLTDVYLIAKRLAARLLEVAPDDEPAKDAIAALRQKVQLTTLLPQ